MSGKVGDLSSKQEELLQEFKSSLSDVLEPKYDDHLLLQFLRARRFDLKKSEDMFRKHLQWRKIFSDDYIINDYKSPEVLRKYCLAPFLGFDKEGSPIRLIPVGQMDLKGIMQSCRIRDMEEYAVCCLDTDKRKTRQYNEKFGRFVETRTFIFDLEGLTIRQVTKLVLELVVAYLKLYEANYPENLKTAFVIHIPYFFAWIFNIVKSILNEDTIKKVKIFGKDGYQEELLKVMDPEILPVCYGGTKTDEDGDPTCRSIRSLPGPVPQYYYLKHQRKLNSESDGAREITIGRRSKKEVIIYVDSPDSTLVWEIEVPNQDIDFSIFYKKEVKSDKELDEVLPSQRIGGSYGPAAGSHVAEKAGKYIFVFNNEFSLMRSKHVIYKVTVLPPTCDEKGFATIPY